MPTSLRDLVESDRTKASASGPYGGNRSISSGSVSLSMGELVRDHNQRHGNDDSSSDDGSYSTIDFGGGGRNNKNHGRNNQTGRISSYNN